MVAGWNYQQNKQEVELSDLALENIDALARGRTWTGFGDIVSFVYEQMVVAKMILT